MIRSVIVKICYLTTKSACIFTFPVGWSRWWICRASRFNCIFISKLSKLRSTLLYFFVLLLHPAYHISIWIFAWVVKLFLELSIQLSSKSVSLFFVHLETTLLHWQLLLQVINESFQIVVFLIDTFDLFACEFWRNIRFVFIMSYNYHIFLEGL